MDRRTRPIRRAVAGCLVSVFLLSIVVAGCGKRAPTLYHVSGTVTFAGKPVPAGSILFEPDTTKGNSGPAGYAKIKNGKYDTRNEGRGVVGGPHIVRITGLNGVPDEYLPEGTPLFPEYTKPVDLPKKDCAQDFDVPGTGALQGTGPQGGGSGV